jgi:beta-lactam-binding protein with PASTA domain
LVLGEVVVEECDPLQLPRTVVDQSPAPGTSVPPGAAVAITICRR